MSACCASPVSDAGPEELIGLDHSFEVIDSIDKEAFRREVDCVTG